ncbi:hypothetical protein [Nonomuraea salmonea]|uniref:hypothetical protein n=1 Tax=Nonomuraea salmonea TaxID=46181 RepID=UPI0031E79046
MLGTLALRTDADLDDADRRILERAALVTALVMLLRRSPAEAEARVQGELLDDLLDGKARDSTDSRVEGAAALEARIRRVGLERNVPYVVLSARCASPRHRGRAAFWAASYAAAAHGLAAARGEEVVLLLPGDVPGETARRVAKELGGGAGGAGDGRRGGPGARPVRGARRAPGGQAVRRHAARARPHGRRRRRPRAGLRRPADRRAPRRQGGSWRRRWARCSTTTRAGARRWCGRWRRTSAAGARCPGRRSGCTSTSTPFTSGCIG